jgi:hypothetical protein
MLRRRVVALTLGSSSGLGELARYGIAKAEHIGLLTRSQ